MSDAAFTSPGDEFITLIGADMSEIHQAYQAQGLGDRQYAIVGRAGRHSFSQVSGGTAEAMFDGRSMIAATFRRPAGS